LPAAISYQLAYDRDRTSIHNTDFMVLRAPSTYQVDNRPRNFGLIRWWRNSVDGIRLKVSRRTGRPR
jgi:hypothetical protein